jgi:hypothetical protein
LSTFEVIAFNFFSNLEYRPDIFTVLDPGSVIIYICKVQKLLIYPKRGGLEASSGASSSVILMNFQ